MKYRNNQCSKLFKVCRIAVLTVIACLGTASFVSAGLRAEYLYGLSRFDGPVSYMWVSLGTDPKSQDLYVADLREKTVDVFGPQGMEIFSFGEDRDLDGLKGLALDEQGRIYLLQQSSGGWHLVRCDFRGDPEEEIILKDLPERFGEFAPDRLRCRGGRLYLADSGRKWIVVSDLAGVFLKGWVIDDLLTGIDEKKKSEVVLDGFNVDRDGNIFLTIPLFFSAAVLTPEGKFSLFGTSGSAPGKFGIVSGIAADDHGRIYVSDVLRCVVMIFDRDFRFITEFGFRGGRPHNLIAPRNVEVRDDRIYVSQLQERGVSVFRLTQE